ncbi:hypothetical protein C2E23DRAFT_826465 [Lenzites betulinus]|nr:hypothetical protein C2E23DRAFT_826465 [Lenzites betulinus]
MARKTVFSPSISSSQSAVKTALSPARSAGPSAQHPPGSACIFGMAVLENPRLADPSKVRSITFDASFWMGEESMPLTACFRYFNKDNMEIPENGTFAIMATVAQPNEAADLCTMAPYTDYDLIGDILWMVHTPGADAHQQPMLIANGPSRNIQREQATFEMQATQFVQQLREANPGSVAIHVEIPDTGRFKNGKKPLPSTDGSNAAVIGRLTSIERAPRVMAAEVFCITLENVAYLPRSHISLPVHNPTTPPAGTRRKFNFQDVPDTPPPPAKKRALIGNDGRPSASASNCSSSTASSTDEGLHSDSGGMAGSSSTGSLIAL